MASRLPRDVLELILTAFVGTHDPSLRLVCRRYRDILDQSLVLSLDTLLPSTTELGRLEELLHRAVDVPLRALSLRLNGASHLGLLHPEAVDLALLPGKTYTMDAHTSLLAGLVKLLSRTLRTTPALFADLRHFRFEIVTHEAELERILGAFVTKETMPHLETLAIACPRTADEYGYSAVVQAFRNALDQCRPPRLEILCGSASHTPTLLAFLRTVAAYDGLRYLVVLFETSLGVGVDAELEQSVAAVAPKLHGLEIRSFAPAPLVAAARGLLACAKQRPLRDLHTLVLRSRLGCHGVSLGPVHEIASDQRYCPALVFLDVAVSTTTGDEGYDWAAPRRRQCVKVDVNDLGVSAATTTTGHVKELTVRVNPVALTTGAAMDVDDDEPRRHTPGCCRRLHLVAPRCSVASLLAQPEPRGYRPEQFDIIGAVSQTVRLVRLDNVTMQPEIRERVCAALSTARLCHTVQLRTTEHEDADEVAAFVKALTTGMPSLRILSLCASVATNIEGVVAALADGRTRLRAVDLQLVLSLRSATVVHPFATVLLPLLARVHRLRTLYVNFGHLDCNMTDPSDLWWASSPVWQQSPVEVLTVDMFSVAVSRKRPHTTRVRIGWPAALCQAIAHLPRLRAVRLRFAPRHIALDPNSALSGTALCALIARERRAANLPSLHYASVHF